MTLRFKYFPNIMIMTYQECFCYVTSSEDVAILVLLINAGTFRLAQVAAVHMIVLFKIPISRHFRAMETIGYVNWFKLFYSANLYAIIRY